MLKTFSFQKSQSWVKKTGTDTFEAWYPLSSDLSVGSLMSTVSIATGTMVAIPFIQGKERLFDSIAFEITAGGGVGSVARVGIYTNSDVDGELYPDQLVIDGGEFDTTGIGVKSTSINAGVLLARGRVYWAVYLCGVAAPTVRGITAGGCANILGFSSSSFASPQNRITVSQAYGSLPRTFPNAATFGNGIVPAIFLRFLT